MSLFCHSQWLLLSARLLLAQTLRLPGIRLENKKMSLVLHFRKAPVSSARELRTRIRDIAEMLGPEGLHVIEGRDALELLPPEIRGKGLAVQGIASGVQRTSLPIYIGDDTSDESAFAAFPAGITIRVGRGRGTVARYMVRDTNEVRKFLERLETKLS
jgi:trehalose 6-phosphate phosphatase